MKQLAMILVLLALAVNVCASDAFPSVKFEGCSEDEFFGTFNVDKLSDDEKLNFKRALVLYGVYGAEVKDDEFSCEINLTNYQEDRDTIFGALPTEGFAAKVANYFAASLIEKVREEIDNDPTYNQLIRVADAVTVTSSLGPIIELDTRGYIAKFRDLGLRVNLDVADEFTIFDLDRIRYQFKKK